MVTQMLHLTPEERALCTAIGDLLRKGGWTSRRIGSVFGLSEHTVRSLVCGRRRPGPFVLKRLEKGCVQFLLDTKTPGARHVWWYLLDATVRCGTFAMRDPEVRLREMLQRDVEDGAAPEEFYDLRSELWETFEAGGSPAQELEAAVKLPRFRGG